MASVPELYGAAVAMHHAGVPWQKVALRLQELADARAILGMGTVYEIVFDTGEVIRYDGIDWVYARSSTAGGRGEDAPSASDLDPSPPEQ